MRKNAKLYRNALRGLVAALALGGLQVAAHAAYTNATPPPNYKAAAGAAQATYAAAANDRTLQNFIRQVGGATVTAGGQAVKMGVAYKIGNAAGRVAAAVVYAHPGLRTAASIAAWLGSAYLVYDSASGTWRKVEDQVGGQTLVWIDDGKQYSSATDACRAAYNRIIASKNRYTFAGASIRSNGVQADCKDQDSSYPNNPPSIFHGVYSRQLQQPLECPPNTTQTPAGCLTAPLTQPEFVEDLAAKPMPHAVPTDMPGHPLPVESPSPILNPTEGDNPTPSPMRIPTGDPIPIPNTNPQQYRQPYVDIVPSPTVDNPWRVDVKPGETTSTNPNPVENPTPDGQDKPAEEQEKSLCEKHPDILACSKPELDVPDGEIPKVTKQITYAEEGGFGGGSCPSNVYANLHGKQTMVYEWTRTCSVVSTYIRPIILLLGAMGALFILIPGRDS
jgi:hypothetical protein